MTPIRALTEADLPAAVRLLSEAGLAGATTHLARYLKWQPDGAWALSIDGAPLGTVSLLRYGPVGFVGCMAVDASVQGRGYGRALLEHAHDAGRRAGVATFLLEATPVGERLYRRLGYVVEHETVVVMRAPTLAPGSLGAAITEADREGALALDRGATGSRREVMIRDLLATNRGAVVRDGAGVAAYGLIDGGRLGPVIARDPGAGRAVVDQLAPACIVAAVPRPHEHAMAALAAHGFTEHRPLSRMRLGPPVEARAEWLWALVTPGTG